MTRHSVARIECVGGPLDGEVVASTGPTREVFCRGAAMSAVRSTPDTEPLVIPRHRYRLKTWRTAEDSGVTLRRVYSYEGIVE